MAAGHHALGIGTGVPVLFGVLTCSSMTSLEAGRW